MELVCEISYSNSTFFKHYSKYISYKEKTLSHFKTEIMSDLGEESASSLFSFEQRV